jgi:hypothetical protein
MYDWDALWHEHTGYRTGYTGEKNDLNELADELSGTLVHPAKDEAGVAVYDSGDSYVLVGHGDGLQILDIPKHALFDITLRFVTEDEDADTSLPYVEILVDNLATGDEAAWRGAVTQGDDGAPLVAGCSLRSTIPPDMPFTELSFSRGERFRATLLQLWQEDIPQLKPLMDAWFKGEKALVMDSNSQPLPEDARTREMLERYAEIIHREQAVLSRLFSDNELHLIAEVLRDIHFESAASCRGVWLAVEARLIHDELDRELEVDAQSLLTRMKALSFAQEVALIEALSPLREVQE